MNARFTPGRPRLVSDNSNNPELVESARNFYGALRAHSEAELDRRIEELAKAYRLRGPCKAGHPVTLENTLRVGKAGYRCRQCRQGIGLRYWHDKGLDKFRERKAKSRASTPPQANNQ